MSKKMSNEELYLKLIDKGYSPYEADEYMHQMITYRYLDSLSPSEQHIRHALFMDNKAAAGAYGADILGMEEGVGVEMFDKEVDEELAQLPPYQDVVSDIKDIKDKLNDVLIDKHLYDVVIKHNVKDEETDEDESEKGE